MVMIPLMMVVMMMMMMVKVNGSIIMMKLLMMMVMSMMMRGLPDTPLVPQENENTAASSQNQCSEQNEKYSKHKERTPSIWKVFHTASKINMNFGLALELPLPLQLPH